jgi:feruloyl esterase
VNVLIGLLVGWVTASALPTNRYFPNRTRPLCPFPSYARYTGRGSVEDAASFACAE